MIAWLPDERAAGLLGELPGSVQLRLGEGPPDPAEFVVVPPSPSDRFSAALSRMAGVRVVQLMSSGHDHLRWPVPPDAVLCTARGAHDVSVAEWVVAVVLAALRDLPDYARSQAGGAWRQHEADVLAGKNVLLVGYGSIGAAVERRLAGFEPGITRVARTARPGVEPAGRLAALLPMADIVILLLPGGRDTRHLFDAAALAAMRDGALLVNAGRGSVVATDALTAEVGRGRLRAALDVIEPEPLPAGHPLWSAPNVLITPHVASHTTGRLPQTYALVGDQIRRYVAGRPLRNVVARAGGAA